MTGAGHSGQLPVTTDPRDPLSNLAAVRTRLDSLSRFLRDSVASNTLLPPRHLASVSSELTSAIHLAIASASALVSSYPGPPSGPEIVEVGAEELLAEQHPHLCEVCGKGFRRDANLRMHMRAHGHQYKTPQSLPKPTNNPVGPHVHAQTAGSCTNNNNNNNNNNKMFSCPYVGCNKNKDHVDFRPMKAVTCVKNHFKRAHCPRMYTCTRCNNKRFSVLGDLNSHMKSCGDEMRTRTRTRTRTRKWLCCCGTGFSRKDKLFSHIALFEGHMPAVQASPLLPVQKAAVMIEDENKDEDNIFDFLGSAASGSGGNGDLSNGCSLLNNDKFFGFLN
ncbi:hypothetical protein vseg_015642 [Gypsophila vaccaria]